MGKIPLSQQEVAGLALNSADLEALTRAIAGCKIGDWEARKKLDRLFQPLLVLLAEKRAGEDIGARNRMLERGREGLQRAAKRFPKHEQVRHFRLFALPFIEVAMDRPPSFWKRLFGRRPRPRQP